MSVLEHTHLVANKILNFADKTGRTKDNEKHITRSRPSDKLRPFSEIKTLTFSFSRYLSGVPFTSRPLLKVAFNYMVI